MACNKKRYLTRKDAKAEAKKMNVVFDVKITNQYKCLECDYWHNTSMNKKKSRNFSRKNKGK
jgi:hypothetical protein